MVLVTKGDVWLIEFPDSGGREQKGIKTAVILGQEKKTGMVMAAPTTTTLEDENFDFTHALLAEKENGLDEESILLLFQLRSLDPKRLVKRFGKLSREDLAAVDAILVSMLKLKIA